VGSATAFPQPFSGPADASAQQEPTLSPHVPKPSIVDLADRQWDDLDVVLLRV
jgi:hypothetical protein